MEVMTQMDRDSIVSMLNELIETCRDGQAGFKEAADNVKSPDLKTLFNEVSAQRMQFVAELQGEVRALGGDAEKTGSTAGTLHRAWIDIKGTLSGKSDQAILNEAERGEDSGLNAYAEALKKDLPGVLRNVVLKQYENITNVHDRVKQLRDAKTAKAGRG